MKSSKGQLFWNEVLQDKHFHAFFEKYPNVSEHSILERFKEGLVGITINNSYSDASWDEFIILCKTSFKNADSYPPKKKQGYTHFWARRNTEQYYSAGKGKEGAHNVHDWITFNTFKKLLKLEKTEITKNKENEVHEKTEEQGTTRCKGNRSDRKKIQIASASRPRGSRITDRRKRSRARRSSISGERLFSYESCGMYDLHH